MGDFVFSARSVRPIAFAGSARLSGLRCGVDIRSARFDASLHLKSVSASGLIRNGVSRREPISAMQLSSLRLLSVGSLAERRSNTGTVTERECGTGALSTVAN